MLLNCQCPPSWCVLHGDARVGRTRMKMRSNPTVPSHRNSNPGAIERFRKSPWCDPKSQLRLTWLTCFPVLAERHKPDSTKAPSLSGYKTIEVESA